VEALIVLKCTELIEELFDVAHANAMELMENEEDKLFLQSQRKKKRPGCMKGVDKVTEKKAKQTKSIKRRRTN